MEQIWDGAWEYKYFEKLSSDESIEEVDLETIAYFF